VHASFISHSTASVFSYSVVYLKNRTSARHWWLLPVILAAQEAEISRITVRNQPRQIVCETLSGEKPITKKGW
jgi:hypothetical protein